MKGTQQIQKIAAGLGKYRYVLLVILVGILLLAWPTGEKPQAQAEPGTGRDIFQVEQMEKKLEKALSQVEGAGDVTVVLTLQGGPRQVLAQDGSATEGKEETRRETSTILLSKGSGQQEPAVLQELAPIYQGALVVSQGGEDPRVKLALCQAVSALTGLRTDQISVCKGK
ncbi:MAG: stage III sporulation protein AG [Oscillospiraceae bacterium]|nr:stage III sporulation protein AG [Oscillospiraceae bacterium]